MMVTFFASFPVLVVATIILVEMDTAIAFVHSANAAVAAPVASTGTTSSTRRTSGSTVLRMGIMDSLKDAFSNDSGLSKDKSEGQLEGPGIGSDYRSDADLTDVQRKWLASQEQVSKSGGAAGGVDPSLTAMGDSAGGKGAPLTIDKLVGTSWLLSLYLCGIPTTDPSSNLYGSRTKISNRNKDPRSVGLPLGATLPEQPNAEVQITLLADGIAEVEEGDFTTGQTSRWVLAPNGRTIRISMDCTGYTRTVSTKGTIQKVFWSDGENEVTTKTSSEYSIPPGTVYAELGVGYGKPGEVLMLGLSLPGYAGNDAGGYGVMTVERSMGLLGATTKLEVCGKLTGKMIMENEEDR